MCNEDIDWSASEEAALKKLIRETIDCGGDIDAAAIPHRLKEALKRRVRGGGEDLDAYVDDTLKELRATRR